jgi:hypothetical protein
MTRILFAAILLLVFAPLLRAGEHEPNAQEFKALCGVAQGMDHTTFGEAYEEHFRDSIQDAMRDALKSCASRSKPPYEVDLVFVVAANGKVEHVFADPNQPVSGCVAAKLSREKVPAPPRDHWMQLVNIYINP